MTQQVVRAKVTFADAIGLNDAASNTFYLEATGSNPNLDFVTPQTPQDAIAQFYNTNFGSFALNFYLGRQLSRSANATRIDWTDITAHLDGSPAGAPFRTDFFTLGSAAGTSVYPGQVCAACSYTRDYGGDLEHGGTATLPTSHRAIHEGAPATHSGRVRPRARDRGRFYLGPLHLDDAIDLTTGNFSSTFISDVLAAMHGTLGLHNAISANQFQFVQWSRRNASVANINRKFVSEGPATQRRRQDTTASRVHVYTAL